MGRIALFLNPRPASALSDRRDWSKFHYTSPDTPPIISRLSMAEETPADLHMPSEPSETVPATVITDGCRSPRGTSTGET